jgi:hypothetical protein
VVSYLTNSALLDQITEFQSFDFHQAGAWGVTLAIALCFAGAFAALSIRKPARFLLSVLLTAMALRSVRALPLAALLLLPLANGSITAVLVRANGLAPWLRRGINAVLRYGEGLHVIERRFRGFAIVPPGGRSRLYFHPRPCRVSGTRIPRSGVRHGRHAARECPHFRARHLRRIPDLPF